MPASHRAASAFLCAVSGFAVILAMGVSPFSDLFPLVLLATCGAAVGGAVSAPLFGQPGYEGAGWAAFGAMTATALGAALAGFAFGLPSGMAMLGFLYGPSTVVVALFTSPLVLLTWLGTMTCTHWGIAQLRRAFDVPS